MAYRQEKNNGDVDIVIDGFEKGIADSPEQGIADMRNMNITSVPNEAAVQFKTQGLTLPPTGFGTVAFTVPGVTADTLVAAGGGAGGGSNSGASSNGVGAGGGAGQVLTGSSSNLFLGSYAVTVGAGGAGGAGNGASGANSSIGALIVATGGGGGGSGAAAGGTGGSGATGGSGGGGGSPQASGTAGTGGAANGTGTHAGGDGSVNSVPGSGGGGGSSTAGASAVSVGGGNSNGGAGGDGISSSISGGALNYGGGGGGAGASGGQAGGAGGGGAGVVGGVGTNGTANTGGGGGGSQRNGAGDTNHNGGNGGSGTVVISYTTGACTATGGTITTSGGKTIHTFTSSGTFEITAIAGYTANTVVVASTAGYTARMAIVIVTSTVTGITVARTYYIDDITATTFKLYNAPQGGSAVSLTSAGAGTFTVPSFAGVTPVDSVAAPSNVFLSGTGQNYTETFIIDSAANVWFIGNGVSGGLILNQLYYVGNSGHTAHSGVGNLGIGAWKGYLFTFIEGQVDYIKIALWFATGAGNWVYHWQDCTSSEAGHKALAATDNVLYFCNATNLGSIIEEDGETFDPTDSTTYAYTQEAITQGLPSYDLATCIAQLGTKLLIGGIQQYIYPWDRISPSFNYPLIVPEVFTHRIVSTNQNAYLFSGTRGRIYITNGANMQIFKKMPDSLAGTETPLYTFGDTLYQRNQIYFGVSCRTTAGVNIPNFAGVWAIDIDSQALRMENSLSTGSYAGSVPVLQLMGPPYPTGNGYYIGWIDGSGNGGIDYTLSTPYTGGEAYIDTDIVPVGTYYTQKTFQQIEYKLSKPLVTGESVGLLWRSDLNTAFTAMTLTEGGTVTELSGVFKNNFQKVQWVQFRITSTSTATTPSFVPLRELRMR